MPGAIIVETYTNPSDFYILLAPGVVLGAFVGMKVAQLGRQHLPKTGTTSNVRTLSRILAALILIGVTFAYLRALNTLQSTVDEWAFLAIGGIVISFLSCSIATAIGTWLFLFVRRRFFGKA